MSLPHVKITAVVVAVAAFAGCASSQPVVAPTPPAPTPAASPVLGPADVVGYWSGDRGRLVLRANRGRILGAYDRDDGTLVGQLLDDTLIGWWCEAPSRKPDADAGEVEMTFIVTGDRRTIDGRRRDGSDGAWDDDWDLSWDVGEPPPELVARLDDSRAFCDR